MIIISIVVVVVVVIVVIVVAAVVVVVVVIRKTTIRPQRSSNVDSEMQGEGVKKMTDLIRTLR